MDTRPHSPPDDRRPLHVVLYYWGAVILVLGLFTSTSIYFFTEDTTSDSSRQITGARMYQHDIRLIGGKAAVYATQFDDWFADLWHGRQLAWTIAIIAAAFAGLCFGLGWLISESPGNEPEDGTR